MNYIGIDLGTSSVKMILTDEKMNIISLLRCNSAPIILFS